MKYSNSMKIPMMILCAVSTACLAEEPYQFRAELETVHERNVRDRAAKPAADEFAFADGATVALLGMAAEAVAVARDFQDYLRVSMDVEANVTTRPGSLASYAVMASLDAGLTERQYRLSVGADGVRIVAADSRALAQAFYHLEDLMNLRRAPFLKQGTETRRAIFSTRMVHSGWGMDLVPDGYLDRMAHHGFTSLIVYVKSAGHTQRPGGGYEDVNAIIRRAAARGIDTWLYTSVKAYVHPDDPGAQQVFDSTYGEIARAYPGASGLILVGESCNFPSKDPGACSDPFEVKRKRGDRRPAPGWFPCYDYPAWLACVKKAINRHAPDMKVLFWTYNWSKDWTPEVPAKRMALIDRLPHDANTILHSTFELPEHVDFPNGWGVKVSDYTATVPGPGKVFAAEAARARANGMRIWTMCNTGGHTWDFGTSPYQPIPFQWAKRWRALVKANRDWGVDGLMETHHYGWYPSFITELSKEAFTEGGMPFDDHIRAIAARDFGEGNADEAVALWKEISAAAANHPPTLGNQYGPFRIGPAYPFNFGGRRIEKGEFPEAPWVTYGIGICWLNFTEPLWGEDMFDPSTTEKELELLRPYAAACMKAAERFRAFAAGLDGRRAARAKREAGLYEYVARTVVTAMNVKRGAVAWKNGDTARLAAIAREEYANARAALPLVDADSRLGFECSMDYTGSRPAIEWKLRKMEELFQLNGK